jgi:beta-xylosidase
MDLARRITFGARVLGVLIAVAGALWSPPLAAGSAIRVSHAETVASCKYATQRGTQSARRACRRVEATPRLSSDLPTFYENPVFGGAVPDPMALVGDTDYYAYTTGDDFPVLHSTDLVNWNQVGTALTKRPSWVVATGDWHPWSPGVVATGNSCPGTTSPTCYIMYYVGLGRSFSPRINCVAAAYSPTPAGPFTDLGPLTAADGQLDRSGRPPGCGDDAGYGNIDPAPFVDNDGRAYLYVSTDRACAPDAIPGATCPLAPTISVLRLTPDRLHVAAARVPLFDGTPETWEDRGVAAPTVEGPWLEKHGFTYYLFYSGGSWRAAYGMGVATAAFPTGPFTKSTRNPILRQTSQVFSPGGGSAITGPNGDDWLIYHGRSGSYSAPRTLRIDPLIWHRNRTVSVRGPTTGPQSPAP